MRKADPAVWTFADFQPGQGLGGVEIPLDGHRLALWEELYGPAPDNGGVPSGALVAAMMEAYIKVIQPRPPGNIHASQKLRFTDRGVAADTVLRVDFTCLDKRLRKDRRWLTFGAAVHDGEALVMSGEISTIWAA